MLEFKFPTEGEEQVDARTFVRWCSHRPLLDPLERHSFRDPRLVIVVRGPREIPDGGYSDNEWEDTAVYCVGLTNEMHYVYFHRPGENEVRAFVVDYSDKETRSWVREQVNVPRLRLSGTHSVDFPSLYDRGGRLRGGLIPSGIKYFATDALEKVRVPADLFAEPPAGWKQRLVARYYRGKPYDECDFRSQVIGSFFKALFFATAGTALRLLSLFVGCFLGVRHINPKPIVRPFQPSLGVLENSAIENTVWLTDDDSRFRFSPLNLINPIVLTVVPSMLYGLSQIHHKVVEHGHTYHRPHVSTGYWQCVVWVDGSIVVGTLVIALLVLLVVGLIRLVNSVAKSKSLRSSVTAKFVSVKLDNLAEKRKQASVRRKAEQTARRERELKDIQAAVAAMTCKVSSDQVSIAALPREKRTIRLRASQVKVAACRPFAR